MFKKTRTKTVTEKSFDDRADNYIIKTAEVITKKIFGITFSVQEKFEDLESIPTDEKEKLSVKKKKTIGFNVEK